MDWRYSLFVRLRHAFRRERVLSRLMAAWCAVAAVILLDVDGFSFDSLSFAQNVGWGGLILGTLGFFVVFSLVAMLWNGVHSDSWLMLLAATICVVRWMLAYADRENEFLFMLAACVAYAMFVVYFLRVNGELFAKWQPGRRTVWILALLAGIFTFAMITTLGCLRYRTFSTPNFDFGIFCNAFYNMKESGLPITGCERDRLLSHFAVHISLVLYLILPIYWLFSSPITLQVVQALVLAAGVIPVVLLARHHKLSGKMTVLLAALYAFYPAITTGCFYDFHENCFLPLFLLLTFLFYEKKKYLPMYLFAIGVLLVKEDAAIYLLIFALYVMISERAYLHGAIVAALSIGYFLLCAHLLQTYGEGMMSSRFENLIYDPNDGLFGAIKTALLNPGYLLMQVFNTKEGGFEKLIYALQMLLPLGFLPFCSKKPSRWLLLSPIMINLVTQYLYQYNIGFQYHFGITAFLFWATIKNLPELGGKSRRTLSGIAVAACLCIYLINVVPCLHHYRSLWRDYRDDYREIETLLDTVPEDASVSASTFLLPYLSEREVIYESYYHDCYANDVDYVVLDLRSANAKAMRDVYLLQGYTVYGEYREWVVILQKPQK